MNRRSRRIMWIAIALIVLSWLFPPWVHYPAPMAKNEYRPPRVVYARTWACILDDWQDEDEASRLIFKIDFQRLLVVDAIIVLIAGGLIVSRKSNQI